MQRCYVRCYVGWCWQDEAAIFEVKRSAALRASPPFQFAILPIGVRPP